MARRDPLPRFADLRSQAEIDARDRAARAALYRVCAWCDRMLRGATVCLVIAAGATVLSKFL